MASWTTASGSEGRPTGRPRRRSARDRAPQLERETDQDPDADPEVVARSIALRKLAGRDRTRAELASTLRDRAVPSDTAERVLDRLAEENLVDDEAFAERWVESRREHRHRSRRALRHELAGRGVAQETIDAAVSEVSDTDEREVAARFARRRLPALAGLPPAVRYRRLAGALARRGFASAVVGGVLREVLADESADDAGDGESHPD